MADLNALIAQGVQFRAPPDPFAQYAQMQQLQQGATQNQLAQYQLGAAQRADVQSNAMNQAYQSNMNPDTGEINYPGVYKSLAGSGAGASIPGVQQQQFKFAQEKATLDETLGRVAAQPVALAKATTEAVDAAQKQSRDRLNRIDPYSPDAGQQLLAWHQSNHAPGILGDTLRANGSTTEQSQQEIANAVNKGPQGIADFITRSTVGQQEFAKMIAPIPERVTNGKMSFVIDKNPKSPTFSQKIGGEGFAMEMTPFQKGSLSVSQGNLAVAQQRLAEETATGVLSPDTLEFAGQLVAQGGAMPPLGQGKAAAKMKQQILDRAAQISTADGSSGAEAAAKVLTAKAGQAGATAAERVLGSQGANVLLASSEAKKMIRVASDYSSLVDRTQFPTINSIENAVSKGTGDENIVALNTALNALVNSYARAINPKGVATVSDKTHAREIVNASYSKGQLNTVFKVMDKEMTAALESTGAAREVLRARPAASAPAQAASGAKFLGFE